MSGDSRAFSPSSTSRSSPLYPTSSTTIAASQPTAAQPAMAASTFLPQPHRFAGPGSMSQAPFPSMAPLAAALDKDSPGSQPIASPPATDGFQIMIRNLPMDTDEEKLRLMLFFSQEVMDVTIVPGQDASRTAFVRFQTPHGAQDAKEVLNGKPVHNDNAQLEVNVIEENPVGVFHFRNDNTTSSAPAPETRYFHDSYRISSPSMAPYGGPDVTSPGSNPHYANIFSPQSPIGHHLNERTRQSGKALINNDGAEDDETRELLNDPVRYAENGLTQQRRATAPHIPSGIGRGLTLNTGPGPSSVPNYSHQSMTPHSGHPNLMSPGGFGNTNHPNYQLAGGAPYRSNFPAANPADQNPPCNTLYVGNLPLDTSEEELKALFSKQRGYKRLCFRTKQNGPMCFVEFEDVSLATRALNELYGKLLHNSVKGGIRLSFSKNPLGVRSGQSPGQSGPGPIGHHNGIVPMASNGFTTANGPPPGLTAPPGLPRNPYNNASPMASGPSTPYPTNGYTNGGGNTWNGYNVPLSAGPTTSAMNGLAGLSSNAPNGRATPNGLNGHSGLNGHNGHNGGFSSGYMGR